MKFTGERYVPGQTRKIIEEDHINRYKFVKKFSKDKIVLDIACGTGYGSKIISDSGATKVCGVDISKEAIDYDKTKYDNKNIDFFCQSADNLPFTDNFFDLIVSFETIEHLDDQLRDKYLTELYRVMKNGGELIISTPNKLVTSPNSTKPHNKFHIREYYLEDFQNIISRFNFQIKNIYGQRQIKNWLNKFWVRKFIYLIGLFNKIHLQIYDDATGPEVLPIIKKYEPTYYIIMAIK